MQLLNLGFAMLVFRIALCVLPGVFGIFLLVSSEEKKREMRNFVCNRLFGVSNAIPFPNFERFLIIIGVLSVLFSVGASWFFLLRRFL